MNFIDYRMHNAAIFVFNTSTICHSAGLGFVRGYLNEWHMGVLTTCMSLCPLEKNIWPGHHEVSNIP